ncbi:MAG: tetratricopeptide repeat protein [Anaerolineae bacterium]|nr:tetratricopeptide repeat protein [Anaerolineae bacterium]
MNQNIEIALKQAFSLIEAGNLEDAKALLRPILESEKDNADVWWLYSHAVTDTESARLALNNVLRIDPSYPDARDLLNQLETQQKIESSDDILEMGKDPSFIPAMPSTIPGITALPPRPAQSSDIGFDSSEELPDDMFDDETPEPFYRRPLFYIPLISLFLIIALAIVIIKPFAVNSPAPIITPQNTQAALLETPTTEALASGQATEVPTVQVDTSVTAEAVASNFSDVSTALAGFTLSSDGGVALADTSLGKTLVASICTTAGKEMRDALPKAMDALAKASTDYASQAQMVAVKMVDCTTNSTLLWIGASIEDATAFANGTLTDKDFQAKWRPVK